MFPLIFTAICISVLLVSLLGLRVDRPDILPAQLGIGRKGQLTNVDKRRPQQDQTQNICNTLSYQGPGHRLDPSGAVDQEHKPLFKHVHKDQQSTQKDAATTIDITTGTKEGNVVFWRLFY